MTFRLFVDSDNGVDITPEWDFKETGQKIETRQRARSGAEYVYKWGSFTRKKFSVMFVTSSTMAIVNSWWISNTDLLWMEVGGSVVTSVHLINKATPIGGFQKPYDNLFKGKIELGTY